MAKGQTEGRLFLHALWRSFLLIALGIFLRSTHSSQTNFTFEDTLTQIGLGYPFLFLLGLRARKVAMDRIRCRFCSPTGWLGRCIPCLRPTSIRPHWAYRRIGTACSTTPDSPRIGTRTPISAMPLTNGS